MREIIDDMFFWNAKGLLIDEFCKECFETKEFLDSIRNLSNVSLNKNEETYNQEVIDGEKINFLNNKKRFYLKKLKFRKDQQIDSKIDFEKAIKDQRQKRLE